VDDTHLLNASWPDDLDPATVPFRQRSVTILRRMGYFGDPTLFDTLTGTEVLSWTTAGVGTVADIKATGNEAIRRHHERGAELARLRADMASVAGEPWARHVWRRDRRFAGYLPKGDGTVYDIATTGSLDVQRLLWRNLAALRGTVDAQAALSLPDAVARYVAAITGWHRHRLEVTLAYTGLDGRDPISATEAARRRGVTRSAMYQNRNRLLRKRDRARPPDGVWMPQVREAERDGWPDTYTGEGMAATREFFGLTGSD
jgi:hypothetical protein